GQLKVLEERVAARRRIFETYRTELASVAWLSWMPEPDWSYSTHWLSVCEILPDAPITTIDAIRRLADEFIEARPVWKPMHLQPVFENLKYVQHSNHSVSDGLFERGICLPSGSNMSDAHLERVVKTLRSI